MSRILLCIAALADWDVRRGALNMKDTHMTTTPGYSARLSRRAFLGAMAAGAGLIGLPFSLRAAPGATGPAIAFDGDALILAKDTLSRSDGAVGWCRLAPNCENAAVWFELGS